MLTKGKPPLAKGISCAAATCLALAGLFVTGCGPSPSPPPSPSDSTSIPANGETRLGVFLRANPNPVPGGTEAGKTIITWETGSESSADIYFVDGTNETLF